MFPEDRVLVGVINRRRDFALLRDEHWYRIPQARLTRGVHAEYIAFFLSKAFKEHNGAIRYYAERKGLELVYRRDLLPNEPNHPRAHEVYYKVQLGELKVKDPPIANPTRRAISFIYTTWDRFVHAREIGDLYSTADYFVDRIYHTLRNLGIRTSRYWEAENRGAGGGAQLRILCENGTITASTEMIPGHIYLDDARGDDAILAEIRAAVAKHGGPVTINVPLEGD